jgi:hypothetical protein
MVKSLLHVLLSVGLLSFLGVLGGHLFVMSSTLEVLSNLLAGLLGSLLLVSSLLSSSLFMCDLLGGSLLDSCLFMVYLLRSSLLGIMLLGSSSSFLGSRLLGGLRSNRLGVNLSVLRSFISRFLSSDRLGSHNGCKDAEVHTKSVASKTT